MGIVRRLRDQEGSSVRRGLKIPGFSSQLLYIDDMGAVVPDLVNGWTVRFLFAELNSTLTFRCITT